MGFRRKHNDALLMFCLRHYGQDENGRRTTINYFSTRASAGAGAASRQDERVEGAGAMASATTVRTVINSRGGANDNGAEALDCSAAVLDGFEGVALDAEAEAAIAAALEACAARARASDAAYDRGGEAAIEAGLDDPGESFVRVGPNAMPYLGPLESGVVLEEAEGFHEGEDYWRFAGMEMDPELARIRGELEAREAGEARTP
ncbi:MAG: hypothetical protein E6G94_04875 [Alphaproteobacteria bacterium]|nr:MAG: hypothetical protein E6G94_04875 [Alphaproteobacteria bacterium]